MSRLFSRLGNLGRALLNLRLRRPPGGKVERILIAHYLLLGDTVVLAPLLARLAQRYPQAECVLLVRPALLPLFAARPWGVKALPYDPRQPALLPELRAGGPYDLAFALGDNRYAWLARALGARWIVGTAGDRPAWKNWMLDEAHPYPAQPAALAEMIADLCPGERQIFQPGDWTMPATAGQPMPDLPGGDYAVLHVGASTPLKLWPAERWQALLAFLQSRGLSPVWSAGPGETAYIDRIDPEGRFPRYCGSLDLAGVWRLLAGARLMVCPDTGVAHLGKVVGVPSVVLFGPGSPEIYGRGAYWRDAPYVAVAAEDFPCRNQPLLFRREVSWVRRCGRSQAACMHASAGLARVGEAAPCMSAITLEQVVAACNEALAGKRGGQP